MKKPNNQGTFSIISTKHLTKEALSFIIERNWVLETVSLIETKGINAPYQVLEFLDVYHKHPNQIILLFTSENSIRHLIENFHQMDAVFPRGLTALCVGEKTAKAAHRLLKAQVVLTEHNSSDLLKKLIPQFSNTSTYVYFCGNKRLSVLPDGLKEHGFALVEYLVYETVLTPKKIESYCDAILFFSPSGVESFFICNNWKEHVLAISNGKATSERLRAFGVKDILENKGPGEMAMLGYLENYLLNNNQ